MYLKLLYQLAVKYKFIYKKNELYQVGACKINLTSKTQNYVSCLSQVSGHKVMTVRVRVQGVRLRIQLDAVRLRIQHDVS